jgi:hypothetical protein
MASRSNCTLKIYGTSLCRTLKRGFSSAQPSIQRATIHIADDDNRLAVTQLLKEPNKHFPFPGDVRTNISYETAKIKPLSVPLVKLDELLKFEPLPVLAEHHQGELLPAVEENTQEAEQMIELEPNMDLEMKAMNCPPALVKDLIGMFPDQQLNSQSRLTVLNVTQKSDNDMSAWSLQMEMERDKLTQSFIDSAMNICEHLKREGYWADFIDPTSGRPYLGSFTNSTLFETDERYNQLGFNIEDLGCCKVVRHVLWGSHVFVGTIFTSAPLEEETIQKVLSRVNPESFEQSE